MLFTQQQTYAQLSSVQVQKQWSIIDSIQDHELAKNKLLRLRGTAKLWTKEDELQFLKRINYRYIYLTKYDSALIHTNKGIELAAELKQDSVLAYMYKLKGSSHYYLSNRKQAILNYQKAIEIADKKGLDRLKAHVLSNLGAMFIEEKQNKEAEKALRTSIEINRRLGEDLSQQNLLALRLLGTNYSSLGFHKKALAVFDDLIENCRKNNDSVVLASTLVFQAVSFNKTGNKTKAIRSMDEALTIERKIDDKHGLMATLMHYAAILKDQGDFKQALEKTQEAYTIRAKLFEEQMAEASSDAEIKYKTRLIEKEKKIAEIKSKRDREALYFSEKQQSTMKWIILLLVLVSTLGFFVYYMYQQRQRTRTEKRKAKELFDAILETEEKERTRIARELHDGIVQELAALKLGLDPSSEDKKTTENLDRITNEVRNLSYQMMPPALKEAGLIETLKETLERSLKPHQIEFDFVYMDENLRFDDTIEMNLFRISQELINNTLKHAKANHVSVSLLIKNGVLIFLYEDDGVGFDGDQIKKGLGLNNIQNRLKLIGATLELDSDYGTAYFIRIPLQNKD